MSPKKDAFTDVAENLQNLDVMPVNQSNPTSRLDGNDGFQVVNSRGDVIQLGYGRK